MTRKAFTLIELLVVITVLLMLMGVLVPAVIHVRRVAVEKLARTRMMGMSLAIEQYFLQVGSYPPGTDFPSEVGWEGGHPALGKYSLYYYLCGPAGDGFADGGRTYGPYMELDEDQYKVDKITGWRSVKDPWGNPWIYQENRTEYYRVPRSLTYKSHKPKRYDILSMGADGDMSAENRDFYELPPGTGEEDDITNWE